MLGTGDRGGAPREEHVRTLACVRWHTAGAARRGERRKERRLHSGANGAAERHGGDDRAAAATERDGTTTAAPSPCMHEGVCTARRGASDVDRGATDTRRAHAARCTRLLCHSAFASVRGEGVPLGTRTARRSCRSVCVAQGQGFRGGGAGEGAEEPPTLERELHAPPAPSATRGNGQTPQHPMRASRCPGTQCSTNACGIKLHSRTATGICFP